ncbi:hypothetical protein EV715DRAFT_268256 [Schizophyllum commune]
MADPSTPTTPSVGVAAMASAASTSPPAGSSHGLVVLPSGIVDRPPTPEAAWDRADTVPDADTYDAFPSSRAERKRLRDERLSLEAAGKRPRLLKRYILIGLPPLRAPFHDELSPEAQVIDYRLYRQPNVPAAERIVLERIVLHRPLPRTVRPNDEGYGYLFPDPAEVLEKNGLPLDCFRLPEKPEDPALQNRVIAWTQVQDYVVMSPNASYIPYVPPPHITNYRLRMRTDGNFGAEDWTLVPTYYMPRSAPHLAFIPRCPPAPGHPFHLMFLGVDVWFESVLDTYKPKADKVVLARPIFKELKKLVNPLRKLASEYLSSCKERKVDPMPWARGLEMTIGHLMGRLAYIPVAKRRAVLMARECQRLWRELYGMMNFIHLGQPILTGLVDAPEVKTPHWYIGAVTDDIQHVQLLYHAGVPVWYITEFDFAFRQQLKSRDKLGVPYAEETLRMRAQADMACTNRHPDNLPYIFEGSPKDPKRVLHLHRYATLRVSASRPIEDTDNNKDPLAFISFEGGSSRLRPLVNMPSFIAEVGMQGPPRVQGEAQYSVPARRTHTFGAHDHEGPPLERLPASFYGPGEEEEFVPIDSPVWPTLELSDNLTPTVDPPSSSSGLDGDNSYGLDSDNSSGLDNNNSSGTTKHHAEHATDIVYCVEHYIAAMGSVCELVAQTVSTSASASTSPSYSTWQAEIELLQPNFPFDSQKGDDHRCFPLPSMITGPVTNERCAFYVQAWVSLAPYLIENAQSSYRDAAAFQQFGEARTDVPQEAQKSVVAEGRPIIALRAADWKSLLFARVTMRNPQGRVAGYVRSIREIVGEDFQWDIFVEKQSQPYTLRGITIQPGILPPSHVMKDELMRVHELVFRIDFIELDRRIRSSFVHPVEEVYRWSNIFDDRTWDGVDILNLCDLGEGRGLAAPNWVERMPYVQEFARLMLDWVPCLPGRVEHLVSAKQMGYLEFYWFEEQVVKFYCWPSTS